MTLAGLFAERGLAGFLLKSHYIADGRARPGRHPGRAGGRGVPGCDRAEQRGRRAQPAGRRDRGSRGRTDGVAADGRCGQRDGRPCRSRARREAPRLGADAAGPARAGDGPPAGRGRRRRREGAGRAAAGPRGHRRSRDAARHRPPRARRDLRRGRRGGGARGARHRRDAPRLPVAGAEPGRPGRARPQGRGHGALLRHLPHGEGSVGAHDGGHPRDRGGAQRALHRSGTAVQSAGRGRPAAHGGPHARRGVLGGRRAHSRRHEHPADGRGSRWPRRN